MLAVVTDKHPKLSGLTEYNVLLPSPVGRDVCGGSDGVIGSMQTFRAPG